MNRKILVVGLACLSALAVAQSSGNETSEKKKPAEATTPVQAPRDHASGLPTGKQQAATPKTDGKTSASDDWDLAKGKGAKTSSASWDLGTAKGARSAAPQGSDSNSVHVAAGDVNGDG